MTIGLTSDIRSGVRALRARPATTAFAVVTLAVGIAAATSVFSVVHATLLRPLPFHEPDRLVTLYSTTKSDPADNWSGPDFLDLREQASLLEGIAGSRWQRYALRGASAPEEVRGVSVTDNFFDVLGVQALVGERFGPATRRADRARQVVLSFGLWQTRFGGSPAVVGTTVVLNEVPHTVVGVMPQGFAHPAGAGLWTSSSLRVPEPPFDFGSNPELLRAAHYFDVFARLKPAATVEQARARARAIAENLAKRYPATNGDRGVRLVSIQEAEVGDVRSTMWLLLGAVGCVLLVGCANVAGLLLVRAADRDREVFIRLAVGASIARLARQFLVESLMLGVAGGLLGVLASLWLTDAVVAMVPIDVPRLQEVRVDAVVLGFALVTALAASVLAGMAPASRWFAQSRLGTLPRSGNGVSLGRTRHLLVVGEVAVSAVLLVGAVLMMRTLAHLGAVDPGFRTDSTVSARVSLPARAYAEDRQIRDFGRNVLDRLRRTPGITTAGTVMSLPIDGGMSADLSVHVAGRPEEAGRAPVAGFQVASAGYFETMGIPLLNGRLFTEDDRDGQPLVAVVSESFARRFFAGRSPIGERLAWSDPKAPDVRWHTIVGVVGSTRHGGVRTAPRDEAYVPFDQWPMPFLWLVARGGLGAERTSNAIRAAVLAVDPGRPVTRVGTLDDLVRKSLGQPRFGGVMLTAFAVIAQLMAALGLYGLLAYGVTRRSREIGIRMALGAPRSQVLRTTLREGISLAAVGTGIGLAFALGLSRVMASQLHGVRPTDPVSFGACVVTLAAVSALASLLPALRATRIDPAVTLRSE